MLTTLVLLASFGLLPGSDPMPKEAREQVERRVEELCAPKKVKEIRVFYVAKDRTAVVKYQCQEESI